MIAPELERARPSTGEGFADAVTLSWGDDARGIYGMARLGIACDGQGSALAVLFQELTALYEAHTTGQPSPLPALPLQYAD